MIFFSTYTFSTIYWKDFSFHIELLWNLHQKLLSIWGSAFEFCFCSIDLYVYLFTDTKLFWLLCLFSYTLLCYTVFNSVQFSHSVVSDSLRPHGLQRARLPCPSLSPGACSNSCPSSRWCHPIISSSVSPFSSCFQSFLALGSFPMSQFFASGGQSIGVSASASDVL